MTEPEPTPASTRMRRQPPRFRAVEVLGVERQSPRMVRVRLGGPDLAGFSVDQPAASVRLLLPSPPALELEIPRWNGNEFLLADGRRPALRTFTPRRLDTDSLELDLDIVTHGHGVASEWAETASTGDRAALSGPGRGYTIDDQAPAFLLAGDETALPAICQLLEALPADRPVQVHAEIAHAGARLPLPDHPGAVISWHHLETGAPPGDALVAAVRSAELIRDSLVWAAGEAAAMQRIRKYLLEDLGVPRSRTTVRGNWKHGRAGGAGDD